MRLLSNFCTWKTATTLFCLSLLSSIPAKAAYVTVYSQGYEGAFGVGSGSGRSDSDLGIYGSKAMRAVSFTLSETVDVREISFVGSTSGSAVEGSFTIYLHENGPADTVGAAIGGPIYNAQPTYTAFETLVNVDSYEYRAEISPTILNPGTYWISIVKNPALVEPSQWSWVFKGSATPSPAAVSQTTQVSGYSTYASNGTYLFSLATIPEPGSASLCILAIGAVLLPRRRR